MNDRHTLTYAACFAGLAVTVAVVVGRISQPSMTLLLLAAAVAATVAGAPGMVRRRLWPLASVTLILGAYLLVRAQVAPPPGSGGAGLHLAFYADLIHAGAITYVHDIFPLDGGDAGLRLLLSLVVYAAVGGAALLALSLRRPLPAIIALLALAAYGFTTDESARDPWAAIAFVLFAGGLLASSRSLPRRRWRATDAFAGWVTAAVAVLIGLSIIGTTAVEASRPLRDWRSWDLVGPGTATFRFEWMQNYPTLLDPDKNGTVMRVRSPVASYWRANVLSGFTGTAWLAGTPHDSGLQARVVKGTYVYEAPPAQPTQQGRLVTQEFEVQDTYTSHLFTGGWPTEVRAPARLTLRLTDGVSVAVNPPRGPKIDYTVTAVVPDLKPTDLIGRGRYYPKDVESRYLGLPFPEKQVDGTTLSEADWRAAASVLPAAREWMGLYALNERIVGSETDPYRIALAIQQYLRADYGYSLHPPGAGYRSPYAEFLFATHSGYCQHFAGAMAVLLRFNGIPARVVVGFATGKEEHDGVYLVTRNDAHSWVEAYFPGVGWAQFDPTPGRSIPSADGSTASGPAAEAAATADTGATPLAVGAEGRARVADPGGPTGKTAAPRPDSSGGAPWWLLGLPAVLVAWPAGRALLRRRDLFRGSRESRLEASVSLLYGDLRDFGIDVPPSQTLEETAAYLDRHLGLDTGDLAVRVQAVVFGGRAATEADLDDAAALRRSVRARLRARTTRVRSVLALYGVRPAAGRTLRRRHPAASLDPRFGRTIS